MFDAVFQAAIGDKDSGLPRKLSEWALTVVILIAAILIVGLW